MLSELALTPGIFDEIAQPDPEEWREQLRTLASEIFPRTSANQFLVSNLQNCGWEHIAFETIDRIKDHRLKIVGREFVKKLRDLLVARPAGNPEWPGESDVKWGKEALLASQLEPIERIISLKETKSHFFKSESNLRTIDEVTGRGFWSGLGYEEVEMDLNFQIELLRKIVVHADWIAWINPYALTAEVDFTVELIGSALSIPEGFCRPDFELHAQFPSRSDFAQAIDNLKNNLVSEYRRQHETSQEIEISFWPEFKERRLLAGTYTRDSNGQQLKKVRWGVSMNHVARRGDAALDSTAWNLMGAKALGRWYQSRVVETADKPPAELVVL